MRDWTDSGAPYIGGRSRFQRRPWIRTANRRSVACRTSWRRRALVDELADKLGLLQRRAGERLLLGRRRPWQGPAVAGRRAPEDLFILPEGDPVSDPARYLITTTRWRRCMRRPWPWWRLQGRTHDLQGRTGHQIHPLGSVFVHPGLTIHLFII